MKMIRTLRLASVVTLLVLLFASAAHAQSLTVSGTVKDTTGEPVIGATVVVLGEANKGATTDLDGNFTIQAVPSEATLRISFVGMKTQEVAVNGRTQIEIVLHEDSELLDEVVVVGYGTTSTRKSVGAVSALKTDKIDALPFTNVAQGLQGRTPGLVVAGGGGAPGSTMQISIRGGKTPLFVIDGVVRDESDFNSLNATDIDKISVLKDASATAVYGSRAGDGIIMVTTKKGKGGDISINYMGDVSFSQPAILPRKLTALEYVTAVNDAARYDGRTDLPFSPEQIEKIKSGSDPYGSVTANTDWRGLALDRFAMGTRHTLSLSGSSKNNISYFAAIGYLKQDPLFKEKHIGRYERLNLRSNVSTTFEEIGLDVALNVDGAVEMKHPPVWGYWTIWSQLQNVKPNYAAFNPDGTYTSISIHPLVLLDKRAGYTNERDKRFNVQLNANWKPKFAEGLSIGVLGNVRYGDWNQKAFRNKAPQYQPDGTQVPYDANQLQMDYSWSVQKSMDVNAVYSREFGDHSIEVQGVTTYFREDGENFWARRKKYLSPLFDQLFAGDAETQENSGNAYELARFGYVGRAKYSFRDKYMAEVNFRIDQSDNFPPSKRTGFFPSGGLAWVVSEEPFMAPLTDGGVLSFLKLRTNYGIVGLEGGNRYGYLPTYNLNSQSWVIGGKISTGFSEGDLVSDNFTWYTRQVFDLGADLTFFRDRLSLMLDYYFYRTTGYLMSPRNQYTTPLGKSLPQVKSDSAHRRAGLEMALRWKDKVGDFSYEIGGNFTTFDELWEKNESESLSSLMNPNKRSTHVKNYYGSAYKSDGLYQNIDEIINSPRREASNVLKPGDIRLLDLNGDGNINEEDEYRVGKPTFPTFSYGVDVNLSYKGFFCSALFQGTGTRYRKLDGFLRGTNSEYLVYGFQMDYYTPENRGAFFPRVSMIQNINGGNNYTVNTDYWYLNAAYLRLKSMQVGYDFTSLVQPLGWMKSLKLSLTGTNIFTISKVNKYFDPEMNNDNGYGYPPQRSFSLVANIGF